jgi:putative ABC transport system permease protein
MVSQTITAADPELTPARIRPMSMLVAEAVSGRRANALLTTAFATLALALAAIGIGGLVSCAVSRRTAEMAVRLALGASSSRVLALVIGQALVPVGAGVGVGLAASLAATRIIESLLFAVTPYDGWTFAIVIVLLALVTMAAAWLPARRALAIQPVEALRTN